MGGVVICVSTKPSEGIPVNCDSLIPAFATPYPGRRFVELKPIICDYLLGPKMVPNIGTRVKVTDPKPVIAAPSVDICDRLVPQPGSRK